MCGISGGVLGLFIWGVWVKKWLKNPKIGFVLLQWGNWDLNGNLGDFGMKIPVGSEWKNLENFGMKIREFGENLG